MKLRVCSDDSASASPGVKPRRASRAGAAVGHLALQLAARRASRRRRPVGVGALGGEQDEGVEHVVVEPGRVLQGAVAPLDGAGEAVAQVGFEREVAFEVGHRERDVAGLVVARQVGDAAGQRVGGVAFEEAEQREERALAHHRQEERGDGEVGLVEQRLQRGPAADGGQRQRPTGAAWPAG